MLPQFLTSTIVSSLVEMNHAGNWFEEFADIVALGNLDQTTWEQKKTERNWGV